MADKINFTQAAIDRLPAPAEGRTYYADAKTPGLVLCVWHTGVRTFELYKRMGGRPRRLKIGRFPGVTVEQARKEVARMTGELAQGSNPAHARRAARDETTVGELFALYLDGHAKPHKRTWKEDEAQYKRYLARWKARKLSELRPADVTALHAKIGRENGHYAANRMLALLSAMFNHAARLGYEGGNPAKGVKHFKEQTRDRFLRADEIRLFFDALGDAQTPDLWRDFFTVALLTGARRANVMSMAWADVELTRGLWRIPESQSKNKEPLLCVLPPAAVDTLQRRADDNAALPAEDQSPYVFPGKGKTGHVFDPTKPWKDLLKRAGIKNLRLHDLRRTLGSWQAATGASLSIIGRSLGHKNVATTAVYARLDLDPVRASVNTAADAIMAAANLPAGQAGGHAPKKALPVLSNAEGPALSAADAPAPADGDGKPRKPARRQPGKGKRTGARQSS
jgi:integrase